MSNHLHYCKHKVAVDGSDLYYALYFHPPAEQHALLALFTFEHELNAISTDIEDPGVARIKLQWWHNELLAMYQSQARHPVTHLLLENTQLTDNCLEDMQAMIELTEKSIQANEQQDLQTLRLQRYQRLWQLAGRVCVAEQPEQQDILAQAAATVAMLKQLTADSNMDSHELNTMQTRVNEMHARHCPLFAIILSRIAHAGANKHQGILPIHKLWIAWRSQRKS